MSGKGNEAGALDALFEGDEVQEVLAERRLFKRDPKERSTRTIARLRKLYKQLERHGSTFDEKHEGR